MIHDMIAFKRGYLNGLLAITMVNDPFDKYTAFINGFYVAANNYYFEVEEAHNDQKESLNHYDRY
jgi:hypothetical protein